VTSPEDPGAQPVDVRILCNPSDKAAFEEALAVFLDGQGLPGGYVFSVRELDVPMIPMVRMEPEARS
jgi:hypothetical protein